MVNSEKVDRGPLPVLRSNLKLLLPRNCTATASKRLVWLSTMYLVLGLGMLAYFAFVARRLSLDPDEPYYVLGGTFVMRRRLPYLDFFLPQTPLTVYVYGFWQQLYGYGMESVRILGAVLTAVTGLLTFHLIRREAGLRSALIGLLFYCLSLHVIQWMVRAKTFGLCGVLTMLAVVLITKVSIRPWHLFVAGLLVGLTVTARLMFAPFIVSFLATLPLRHEVRQRFVSSFAWAVGGISIGVLPCLVLWLVTPDTFMFQTLRYHGMREGASALIGNWDQKFLLLRLLVGGQEPTYGAQCLLLWPIAFAALYRFARSDQRMLVVPTTALVLFVTFFLPTPSWDQYYAVLTPLGIVAFVLLFKQDRMLKYSVPLALVLPFALVYWPFFDANLRKTKLPVGIQIDDAVGWAIRNTTRAGDVVAAKSASYLAAAGRLPHECGFNVFSFGNWQSLTPEQVKRYHLCTDDKLRHAILNGEVDLFAATSPNELGLADQLQAAGWHSLSVPPATLWLAPKPRGRR